MKDTQLAVVGPEPTFVEVANKLISQAIDSKSAVEVIQELRRMRKEDEQAHAERAFDASMKLFQAECPIITKDKSVKDQVGTRLYDYSPIESIVKVVKPIIQKHGFHYTLSTDVESQDGWVIAICTITHELGAKRESRLKLPLGGRTRAMSATQEYAACLTFASRRVFCNAFGIVCAGEDKDGLTAKPKAQVSEPTPKELLNELWSVLQPVSKGDKTWKTARAWLIDKAIIGEADKLTDLQPKELQSVIEQARKAMT